LNQSLSELKFEAGPSTYGNQGTHADGTEEEQAVMAVSKKK
jgi:hypothetical protein